MSYTPPKRPEMNEENILAALNEHGTVERASVIGLGRSPALVYEWLKKRGLVPERYFRLVPIGESRRAAEEERAG